MESRHPRQGRIVRWLQDHGATLSALAAHMGISLGHASKVCKSATVPTSIRAKMESFETPTGERIPRDLLPAGVDRKPGPEKGWLDDLRAKAALAEQTIRA